MIKEQIEPDVESVRRDLKEKADSENRVRAVVFFNEVAPGSSLPETAKKAIDEAAAKIGKRGSVTIGSVRQSANSASVVGDADAIAEVQSDARVKAVLPSEIDDIYPKPVGVRRLGP